LNPKITVALFIAALVSKTGVALALTSFPSASKLNIVCPLDGSPYVWTPVGSKSENFIWVCLECGHHWQVTYPEDSYRSWLDVFLDPAFVRDYTVLYLRKELDLPDPLKLNWIGGRQTPERYLGYETYVFKAKDLSVTIGYPVVLPQNTVYRIKIEDGGRIVWEGQLHRRRFLTSELPSQNNLRTVYDYYGGVGVFKKGIHVIATSYDPLTLKKEFQTVNDFWQALKEKETTRASSKDFVSIIISRGDYPTGGHAIQIKSFSWLESYPVKLRFEANFTDPGEGVYVTEAFTNPLVLIPLGRLSPGLYTVEVHVDTYILTFDAQGKPVYTLLLTFREELWTQTFVVID